MMTGGGTRRTRGSCPPSTLAPGTRTNPHQLSLPQVSRASRASSEGLRTIRLLPAPAVEEVKASSSDANEATATPA
eukprot:1195450-Prorocentrum_minimum.AAC.7